MYAYLCMNSDPIPIASAEAVAAAKAAQSEMYSALLARRQNLMAEFEKKAARYKEILVKEMVRCGHSHWLGC